VPFDILSLWPLRATGLPSGSNYPVHPLTQPKQTNVPNPHGTAALLFDGSLQRSDPAKGISNSREQVKHIFVEVATNRAQPKSP
jgi:hypothetical protein